jgi:hypothetical protein
MMVPRVHDHKGRFLGDERKLWVLDARLLAGLAVAIENLVAIPSLDELSYVHDHAAGAVDSTGARDKRTGRCEVGVIAYDPFVVRDPGAIALIVRLATVVGWASRPIVVTHLDHPDRPAVPGGVVYLKY